MLFDSKAYPLMYKKKAIGKIKVSTNRRGQYIYSVDIPPDTEKSVIPWDFTDINGQFVSPKRDEKWNSALATNWVKERVFPPERQDADQLLEAMKLGGYDELEILKKTKGVKNRDKYWIDFTKGSNESE